MAKIEILAVAHALIAGNRGAAGGAPSKDSVVGVALVQGNLVTFGGRRGGVLRYFTHKKLEMAAVMQKFESKLSGTPFGKQVAGCYAQVTDPEVMATLVPNIEETVCKGYYKAMANKKLNIKRGSKAA
jgi:hypothetical protein